MISHSLRRVGLVLLLTGVFGSMMTAVSMIYLYSNAGSMVDAPGMAESISQSMLPAMIGGPLIIAGLVILLLSLWKSRLDRHVPRRLFVTSQLGQLRIKNDSPEGTF